jgi:hypothetical protein
MRGAVLVMTIATLSGCNGESKAQKLLGVLSVGQEHMGFIECHELDKSCEVQAMYSDTECWFAYGPTDQPRRLIAEQLKNNRVENLNLGARFLVELKGSRANGENGFGHLGQYPCEVTATQIVSIKFFE